MQCPDCKSDLKTIECKGIMIDECVKCHGKWFDRDELRKVKDNTDKDLRWLDFDPFGKDAEKLTVASEGRICPKCLKQMDSLKYMDSEVVIDKCNQCEGIWLEAGELMKIIKYLENRVVDQSAKAYARDTFKEFIEIFTGPENVISEAKDFLAILYFMELRIAAENPKLVDAIRNIYRGVPLR